MNWVIFLERTPHRLMGDLKNFPCDDLSKILNNGEVKFLQGTSHLTCTKGAGFPLC